jgi:hypothetical protein
LRFFVLHQIEIVSLMKDDINIFDYLLFIFIIAHVVSAIYGGVDRDWDRLCQRYSPLGLVFTLHCKQNVLTLVRKAT